MVQETAVEGYEFNPKKELPRFYNPNYGSKTYDRYYGPDATGSKLHAGSELASRRSKLEMEHSISRTKEHGELAAFHQTGITHSNASHINRITAGSGTVNQFLIDGEPMKSSYHTQAEHESYVKDLSDHSDRVSHEIKQHAKPLDRELHVYSGTSGEWTLGHLKEGDALHTPAFTSTSISPHTAYGRGTNNPDDTTRSVTHTDFIKNILHFHLPKGYKGGVYAAPVSDYTDEHEYLIDKNQKWRVKDITEHTKEISHGSNFVKLEGETQPKIVATKQRQRARFITLVPHEDNKHIAPITEATYHDASMYRTAVISPLASDHTFDRAQKFQNRMHEAVGNTLKDAESQHYRLKDTNSINDISNDEFRHLQHYTTYGSKYINGALTGRGKADKQTKDLDTGITKIFKRHAKPLSEDVHAYSGLRDWSPKTAPGEVFHTPAYTSASLHADRARVFTASRESPDPKYSEVVNEQHIIHFHLPVGYDKSVYIAPHSDHPAEKEILLHKGQSWKHVSTETHNRVHYSKNTLGRGSKRIIKTFVHTVVPHDAKTVSEQTEHTTSPFRTDHNFMDIDRYERSAETHAGLRALASADAQHQHARLLPHFGGTEEGIPNIEVKNISPVTHYTKSTVSQKLNQTAIINHLQSTNQPIPDRLKHRLDFMTSDHDLHEMDKDLDEKSKPLPEDVHAYSGVGAWDISHHKVGDILHTPAYTSASIRAQASKGFTMQSVLHFHLPKGSTHGAYIAGYSHHAREHEFLLKRNQKWKITNIKQFPNQYHVISLAPHTEGVHEGLVHEPHKVDDMLAGNSIRHKMDSKLSSMFVTPHPDYDKESPIGKSLSRYTLSSSSINNALIAGDKRYLAGHKKNNFSDTPQVYKHIKEAFGEAKPIPQEHHVYSGLGHWDPLHSSKAGIGDTLHTPAFTSTSHDLEIARRFAAGGNIIHFHLPKGYDKALNMRKYSDKRMKYESEVLLDHGQTWKIHNITNAKGTYGEPVRIVTVKPHTPETVTEMALTHDPKVLKSIYGSTPQQSYNSIHKGHQDSDAYFGDDGPVVKHVEQLVKHNLVKPKAKKHWNALEDYTDGSIHVNSRLIKLANGEPNHPHETEKMVPNKWGDYNDDPHYRAKLAYKTTQHLDEVMVKHAKPLMTDGHFYAGTGRWNPIKNLKLGDVLHSPAFISTSADPEQAMEFARKGHIIHFKLPKGSAHGVYIGALSVVGDEKEYLINRDKKWKYEGTQNISSYSKWSGKTTKRKIHTFVPHEEEAPVEHVPEPTPPPAPEPKWHEKLITKAKEFLTAEALEHNVEDPAFKNGVSYGVEAFGKLKSDEEHKMLKATKIPKEYHNKIHYYGYSSSNINNMLLTGALKPSGKLAKGLKSGSYDKKSNWIDSESVDTHAALTEMFDTHPTTLTREHHVYSGLGAKDPTLFMKKGVFTTPAYTSTSIRPNIAVKHGNTHRIDHQWNRNKLLVSDDHIIHFHLPVGYTGGKYIQGHTEYHEGEFLLRPKQKWKVVGKESIQLTVPAGDKKKRELTRHIWTVVPHKENKFLTEAYDHDPKRDLKRSATVGNNPNWMYKHDELVHARTTERSHRRFDEHVKLSGMHNFFDPHIHDYTNNSSHLAYHLVDPEATHEEDREPLNHQVNKISDAIKKHTHPLERDHHVYSGIAYNLRPNVGDVVHIPAFTSTSLDINIAKRFAQGAAFGRDKHIKHILHFHLPAGYDKGVYLGDHCSHHQEEHEFLLDKGQKWKIHGVKEYHTGMYEPAANTDNKIRYTKYKVVTLKPHDENIQESTYHSTLPFRRRAHHKENAEGFMEPANIKYKAGNQLFDSAHTDMRYDATDQHDRLVKHFDATLPKPKVASDYVKPSHRRTLYQYTESSDISREINEGAVKAHTDGHMDNLPVYTKKSITDLDSAIEHTKLPLPEEVHAYSGLKWKPDLKEGDSFHLPAFTSTSLNPHQSRSYASEYDGQFNGLNSKYDQHVLHFHLPKGFNKGTYVGGISEYSTENEYLLPRNTKWKVVKKKTATISTSYSRSNKPIHSTSQIRTHIYTVVPHHDDK